MDRARLPARRRARQALSGRCRRNADLSREAVDLYLDDRRARGFNALLVNLIEQRFSTNRPANAYGERPFLDQAFEAAASIADWLPLRNVSACTDYALPDEAYFAHADWVLRRAAENGFLVLLTPSYAGWNGDASDRSLALVYLPDSREITIDLGALAGPKVVARWYDPAGGRFLSVSGSPFPASGRRRLKPEHDRNRSGFGDWALVLESTF